MFIIKKVVLVYFQLKLTYLKSMQKTAFYFIIF